MSPKACSNLNLSYKSMMSSMRFITKSMHQGKACKPSFIKSKGEMKLYQGAKRLEMSNLHGNGFMLIKVIDVMRKKMIHEEM